MKKISEVLERVERVNEHEVKIVNELVVLKKVYNDKDGNEKVLEQEFVWYEKTGDFTRTFCRYKREKKMREEMEKHNFYMK